jgi:hypothetical protein
MNPVRNRRASRLLSARARVRVPCRKGALDLGPDPAWGLLDVSQNGARLIVQGALARGQEVSLTLEGPASGRRTRRTATVLWCVALADGRCCVGLRFEEPLPCADLDHYARA